MAALISSFYFLTSNTNFHHNKLFTELCELIDFCLKAAKDEFITADKYRAKWTTQDKESSVTSTKATL